MQKWFTLSGLSVSSSRAERHSWRLAIGLNDASGVWVLVPPTCRFSPGLSHLISLAYRSSFSVGPLAFVLARAAQPPERSSQMKVRSSHSFAQIQWPPISPGKETRAGTTASRHSGTWPALPSLSDLFSFSLSASAAGFAGNTVPRSSRGLLCLPCITPGSPLWCLRDHCT